MEATHHIKKMKIHAPSDVSAKRGQQLVEEAFKLSLLPSSLKHRMILVRYMNIGNIDLSLSANTLSSIINKKVRELISSAVCVDQVDSPDSEVVWFSDEYMPLFIFLEKQILGLDSGSWYWKVIKHRFSLPIHEKLPLQTLIQKLATLQEDKFNCTSLINFLAERKSLIIFLESLDVSTAETLLRVSGVDVFAIHTKIDQYRQHAIKRVDEIESQKYEEQDHHFKSKPQFASLELRKLIERKVKHWGVTDSRTIFLIYHTVLINNPSLALSSRKIEYVIHIADSLARSAEHSIENSSEKTQIYLEERLSKFPSIREDKFESINIKFFERRNSSENSVDQVDVKRSSSVNFLVNKNAFDSDIKSSDSNINAPDSDVEVLRQEKFSVDDTIPSKESDIPLATSFTVFGETCFSPYAGLGYFIRLLDMLDFDKLLALNPTLAELNFPAVVIRKVSQHCGVSNEDPLLYFLGESNDVSLDELEIFSIPYSWVAFIDQRQPLQLLKCNSQYRLLDDKGLIIAQWQSNPPDSIKNIMRIHSVIESQADNLSLSIDKITRNILVVIYRYLRSHANISLKSLVTRPGKYCMTRTHLDFIFEGKRVDMRIRRNGLDINPGWIQWLAYVVSFQYDLSETEHDIG